MPAGPGGAPLGAEWGNETAFVAPSSWFATVDTAGLKSCGSLVLNGDQVGNSLGLLAACAPPAGDPYTIQAGTYSWIVINQMNPGLGGGRAAIKGQVLAFSYTTFGTAGPAIDFTRGLGGISGPPLTSTGGEEEPEILGTPSPALVAPSPARAGFQTLVWNYTDEWKLDAYTAYVKVNNGSPVYFSQGIWSPAPPGGVPLPPPTGPGSGYSNPGDGAPAYPNVAQDPGNKYTKTFTSNASSDWTMTYADGSTFELNGGWVWGHEESIPGAAEAGNTVTLQYTFPIPTGPQSTITLFMSDGDSCGDWITVTMTLNNIGGASPGLQSAGTVHLEQ